MQNFKSLSACFEDAAELLNCQLLPTQESQPFLASSCKVSFDKQNFSTLLNLSVGLDTIFSYFEVNSLSTSRTPLIN